VYDPQDSQVITLAHQLSAKQEKCVILTFDDGPSKCLPKILDILKEEDVPAMFFWQTRLLYLKRPWRRLLDEGHVIGSHTCKHPHLVKMSYKQQYKELFYSKQKIERMTGQPVHFFRPPFGEYNGKTLLATKHLNMTPIMWRVSSMDWSIKDNPSQIVTNVINHLENGAIILLHELRQTLEVLPELIYEIKQKGYTFSLLPNPKQTKIGVN
jgi:peptidoglycan/xylan/chitin deacetylase (PgdA/CDA1 family)